MRHFIIKLIKFLLTMVGAIVVIVAGASLVFAIHLGLQAYSPETARILSATSMLTIFALLVPAYLLNVAWHEFGHLIAGWMSGHRFMGVVVGPAVCMRLNDGFIWRFDRTRPWFGGLTFMSVKSMDHLPGKHFISVAGGPAFSLLGGLLIFLPGIFPQAPEMLMAFFVLSGFLGLFVFCMSIIPYESKGLMNDGMQMLLMLKESEKREWFVVSQKLSMEFQSLPSLELLDEKLIQCLLEAPEGSVFRNQGEYFALLRTMSAKDLTQAEQHLSNLLSDMDSLYDDLKIQVHWIAALLHIRENRIELAKSYRAKLRENQLLPIGKALYEAELARAQARIPDATRALERVHKYFRAGEFPQNLREGFLRDIHDLEARIAEADAKRSEPHSTEASIQAP